MFEAMIAIIGLLILLVGIYKGLQQKKPKGKKSEAVKKGQIGQYK